MSKYIDAEKLISEILKLRSESCISESDDYYEYAKSEIIDIIESIQQKPAEWSEEDEKMLWSAINGLNIHIYEKERARGWQTNSNPSVLNLLGNPARSR